MALEEYFIWKKKATIKKNNRIDLTDIEELYFKKNQGNYFNESENIKKQIRNSSLHFNLPPIEMNYYQALIHLEKNFVKNEIKQHLSGSLNEKGEMKEKVLENFMQCIHDKETYMKKNFHDAKKIRIEELKNEHKNELEEDKTRQFDKFITNKYWSKEESKVRKQKSIEEYIKIVNGLI